MNRLPVSKRAQILGLLVEGMSLRSASRIADVSINTVYKLLIDAGQACMAHHDAAVRNVRATQVQCDEMWAFCYAKEKNVAEAVAAPEVAGDIWTWTALDRDSKLMLSWRVGDRSADTAYGFMRDLRSRLANRVELVVDGFGVYPEVVWNVFGEDVDFVPLKKVYGEPRETERRSRAGVSTSHMERANLTVRMGNRRYTRHTNAFSKKIENHRHMLAVFFTHYNWVRIHSSLRVTPAMEAGLTETLHDMEWVVELVNSFEPAD